MSVPFPAATIVKRRFPEWLKKQVSTVGSNNQVNSCIDNLQLNTVCSEALCPNRGECFSRGTATFLILGNSCTRSCSFCTVTHGIPEQLDPQEPHNVAKAAQTLGLKHIVITSVTRDDLPDGGAAHFAETIHGLKGCFMMIGWGRAGAFCAEALGGARKGEFKDWQTFADNLTVTFALSSKTMSAHLDDLGSNLRPSNPSAHSLTAAGG